jgi:hypothetical protein
VLFLTAAVTSLTAATASAQNPVGGTSPSSSGAVVNGFVRDSSGNPLSGAQVFIGAHYSATTGANGAFRVQGVPHGILTATARHLGFRMLFTRVNVASDSITADLRLVALPAALPAVRVVARAQPYESRLAGFNARRKQNVGYFITREDIERRSDKIMTDALRELPGVRIVGLRGGGSTVFLRGARCPALVFINGFAATLGWFDLSAMDLTGVEGIEVYPNSSTTPGEFVSTSNMEHCGVVAIWTAPMRPNVSASRAMRAEQQSSGESLRPAYSPDSVEEQATLVAGSARVVYPDSLFHAGVSARLVASFVVNTSGRAELATLKVTGNPAPAPEFVSAIRDGLRGSEFTPARRDGHAVRQVVVLPFVFEPASSDSARQSGGAPSGGGNPGVAGGESGAFRP